jgi:hypothetical protein
MKSSKPPTPLSTHEFAERQLHEQRIKARASGRIGDGLDLMKIRDGNLYRDHATFDDYVKATFGVAPGSAYRWIDAAEVVKAMIEKTSPKGESEDPKAWSALLNHRNETAVRFLQEQVSAENRWSVYRKAVEFSRGHEPKPRQLKQAAQTLGFIQRDDPRDSRTVSRIRAFQLIVDVRESAKQDGRNLWATKLTDALHRLGYNPDRVHAPRMPRKRPTVS